MPLNRRESRLECPTPPGVPSSRSRGGYSSRFSRIARQLADEEAPPRRRGNDLPSAQLRSLTPGRAPAQTPRDFLSPLRALYLLRCASVTLSTWSSTLAVDIPALMSGNFPFQSLALQYTPFAAIHLQQFYLHLRIGSTLNVYFKAKLPTVSVLQNKPTFPSLWIIVITLIRVFYFYASCIADFLLIHLLQIKYSYALIILLMIMKYSHINYIYGILLYCNTSLSLLFYY
jgi:hypothetical protein